MKKSFTLIELILVVAIVAILAGLIAPIIRGARQDAQISRMIDTGEALYKASRLFYSDTGTLPADIDDLLADRGISGWDGPYIEKPLTPKDHPYGGLCYLTNRTVTTIGVREQRYVLYAFWNIDSSFAKRVNDAVEPGEGLIWAMTGKVQYIAVAQWLSFEYHIHTFNL
ncbi:MAG: prepilin-type N-terminal cleavage/methylation domain-containing protein [Candidatus Omnitrophica bacterium]|nr:prepilin-type N-terminal cleavage/methylation domain-containing protein [Candidatus Omnitrophota bacterium]